MSIYNHPSFQGIDPNFLSFMDRTLKAASRTNDTTVILKAVMAISNEAKRYNVSMTPDRQQALMVYLRNNLPPNKRAQFDTFLTMLQGRM